MLITEIDATGIQLKPETYTEWSMALKGTEIEVKITINHRILKIS